LEHFKDFGYQAALALQPSGVKALLVSHHFPYQPGSF
jgi:hypothetical protein